MWASEEEHRNVLSPIDPSSELNIRKKHGLPIRYPYASTYKFIEPVKTVIRSAIRSEKPVTGTTLRIASSSEWLSKLKGLVDKIDELPQTTAYTKDTNDSNPTINPRDIQHTKIKLLPYLFCNDVYRFSTEQKQTIIESYTQHLKDKKDNELARKFARDLDNFICCNRLRAIDATDSKFKDMIPNINNAKFEYMMRHIKSEQDEKISRDSIEQERNGLEQYSFIPRMLAREIGKGNVEVKNINRIKDEEALTDIFTKQLRAIVNQRSPSAPASPRNPQLRDKSWRRYSQ